MSISTSKCFLVICLLTAVHSDDVCRDGVCNDDVAVDEDSALAQLNLRQKQPKWEWPDADDIKAGLNAYKCYTIKKTCEALIEQKGCEEGIGEKVCFGNANCVAAMKSACETAAKQHYKLQVETCVYATSKGEC
mmetsp:Transcript_83111/g.184630  ORF Transcript_83111/g.184630 Transcript_83111/m.184630 type:complete len:134 (-) Transcript_83111:48-449(-)